MKSIRRILLGLGLFALPNFLHAQLLTQPIQELAEPDSIVAVTAEAYELTRVAPQDVPLVGTFWEFYPNGLAAPLPCPPLDVTLPIYAIADGIFLVDASGGQVSVSRHQALTSQNVAAAVEAQGNAIADLIEQVQETQFEQTAMMAFGMESSSYDSGVAVQVFNTNQLWLQIITVTNRTASLVIHPPWNVTNAVYDLYYSTNLLSSNQWRWRLRTDAGQTNVFVFNATNAQGFYRVAPPDDLAANDSLGTNFWVGFSSLYQDTSNQLSLSISSPVGAAGTVTTPWLGTNGSVLVITNAGNAGVNGSYLLTNMTGQVLADWTNNYPYGVPEYAYAKGTNWAIYSKVYEIWFVVEYDSSVGDFTFVYGRYTSGKKDVNLNGSAADWLSYDGSSSPTTICAQIPFSRSFTVAAGAVTNIGLLPNAMMTDFDVVQTNGIHVTASAPVSVYAFDYEEFGSTAFTTYPVSLLGTNYCVMARASCLSDENSQLAIVATADNTTVTVTPPPTANLAGSLWTNSFTLQQGQTVQIQSSDSASDLTGTQIVSDKPVAVFAGAFLAFVPDGGTRSANPLMQEQLPVESWGKQVLALSFAGRLNGDTYRVLAASSNTVVWTNGVVAGTNQLGQFLDLNIDGPVEFQASKPIQVAQFANGTYFDSQPGDPCEILLPPTGHYLLTNTVFTPTYSPGFDKNYLNIIVAQSAITNILVDGSHIASTNFVAIGTSGYSGAQLSVTNGVHKVTSSQPVGVQVYGWGDADAYGYFGGVVK